jgi:hypothetical protein
LLRQYGFTMVFCAPTSSSSSATALLPSLPNDDTTKSTIAITAQQIKLNLLIASFDQQLAEMSYL